MQAFDELQLQNKTFEHEVGRPWVQVPLHVGGFGGGPAARTIADAPAITVISPRSASPRTTGLAINS